MLLKLSFLCLNLFVAASFFSPTLRVIFLVPGLLFLLIGAFFEKSSLDILTSKNSFRLLNVFFIVFLLVNFFLKTFYEDNLLIATENFFSSYLQWFWMFFLISFFSKKNSSETLCWTALGAGSILSVIILLQFLAVLPVFGEYLGVLSQPFTSSGILLCSLFLSLSLMEKNIDNKILIVVFSAFQAIAILLLGQLSSWFGLLISLAVFVFASKYLSKRQVLIVVLLPLCLLGLAYNSSLRIKRKIDRLSSFDNLLQNKSIKCRFEIWKINYQLWLEKPILGLKKIMPYKCVISPTKPPVRLSHAHNIYLQNLFNGGLVRFGAWIVFYLLLLVYLIKNWSLRTLPFFCGYLALSLEGFFENWWGDSEVLTLFFLMMLIFINKAPNKLSN
jgi:O-antigen ligase